METYEQSKCDTCLTSVLTRVPTPRVPRPQVAIAQTFEETEARHVLDHTVKCVDMSDSARYLQFVDTKILKLQHGGSNNSIKSRLLLIISYKFATATSKVYTILSCGVCLEALPSSTRLRPGRLGCCQEGLQVSQSDSTLGRSRRGMALESDRLVLRQATARPACWVNNSNSLTCSRWETVLARTASSSASTCLCRSASVRTSCTASSAQAIST